MKIVCNNISILPKFVVLTESLDIQRTLIYKFMVRFQIKHQMVKYALCYKNNTEHSLEYLTKPIMKSYIRISPSVFSVPAEYNPFEIHLCRHIVILVRRITKLCILMNELHHFSLYIYYTVHKNRGNKKSFTLMYF